ncbi:hypothetical protein ILUMI_24167 [Ignelater luminosus]|uniref:PiggyBac transposable element-derived protein domain-containing protein n=1 Tax=Ignelater luminosus TaxID=2038154 RepID=A0A8K0C9M6_IGNLU|nr:hypothetical protein ILUMI_24167 [Ignelater luminosus]
MARRKNLTDEKLRRALEDSDDENYANDEQLCSDNEDAIQKEEMENGFDDKGTRSVKRWGDVDLKLQKFSLPGVNLTINEHLIPFHQRAFFDQYLPSKPDEYSMKMWSIYDNKQVILYLEYHILEKINKREQRT